MLKVIISFYDLCQKAIADSPSDAKLTYAHIKTALQPVIQQVVDSKYLDPKAPLEEVNKFYADIVDDMKREFLTLTDGM
jgi:V-type H+-transporting ATPase subunit A